MIYQILICIWPVVRVNGGYRAAPCDSAFASRIEEYVVKAVREAKLISSWECPNTAYENGCRRFAAAITEAGERNVFMDDFSRCLAPIAFLGVLNSLSQLVLKCAVPGVPDIYQGTELWNLNLVDPDNRRAVDYHHRATALGDTAGRVWGSEPAAEDFVRNLLREWPDGRIKLYVLARILRLRNAVPRLFSDGSFECLRVTGKRSEHVVAFARRWADDIVIVTVGRWFADVLGRSVTDYTSVADWGDTAVEARNMTDKTLIDIFSGSRAPSKTSDGVMRISVETMFSALPVAVLSSVNICPT